MAAANANGDQGVGVKWKVYASGAIRDLKADSPGGTGCARRIVVLSDCDLTVCEDKDGTDVPIAGLKAGFAHDAYVTRAQVSAGNFIAYF